MALQVPDVPRHWALFARCPAEERRCDRGLRAMPGLRGRRAKSIGGISARLFPSACKSVTLGAVVETTGRRGRLPLWRPAAREKGG